MMATITNIILGLQIIKMNLSEGEKEYISAEHDIIYVPGADFSSEEKEELNKLGFFYDEGYDCWCVFT